MLEVLAGVPTVVYGYFALLFVTPLLQRFIPDLAGFNALGPGIVMGIMILPLVSSLSEDALARGAERTARRRVRARRDPDADDAPRRRAGGVFGHLGVVHPGGLARDRRDDDRGGCRRTAAAADVESAGAIETMTAYIVQVSLGDTPAGTLEYRTIFAVGMLLFVMTFVLNLVSNWLRRRFREEYA